MFNPIQSNALYPVLQHYTGCKISSISSEGGSFCFKTFLGERGLLVENLEGDWTITIGDEIVYKIEGEIFNILVKPDKKSSLEDYIEMLNDLIKSPDISYRSRLLLINIFGFLEGYILNSDFLPKKSVRVGPFFIFNLKGNKIINCLN